jgi:hypothetical protein
MSFGINARTAVTLKLLGLPLLFAGLRNARSRFRFQPARVELPFGPTVSAHEQPSNTCVG